MSARELSWFLQPLHEISLELSTLPDTNTLCRRAVEWGLGNLGFDRVSLWFLDPNDNEWSQGTWGTDEAGNLRDESGSRVRRDTLVTPEEFYDGTIPVILRHDELCFDDHRNVLDRADKAMAPLWDGRTIVGELAVDCFLTRRTIDAAELDALVLYARIIAHVHSLLRTKEELARVSEDRGALLRELKHRTRNNLSVIAGLVAMESERTDSPEARGKFQILHDRVEALGALYSLLDRQDGLETLNLDEYLSTVAGQLARAHGADARKIHIELELVPVVIDAQRASSVGLALNELITDCLKYGFAGGRSGTIEVVLNSSQGRASLQIADDGPGLPEDFRLDQSDGLGLGLVSAIARQLRGTFAVGKGKGASFLLEFPL
jgi:two-component sensor histidine kinase